MNCSKPLKASKISNQPRKGNKKSFKDLKFMWLLGGSSPGHIWLVVEPTHLKNMLVKLDYFTKDRMKIENIWNHHLDIFSP